MVTAIVFIGVAGWLILRAHEKVEDREATEARIQQQEAAFKAEENSLVTATLPGMSLQLPGPPVMSGNDQEGEALATVGQETTQVSWKQGELRSEADFAEHARFVAGSFVAAGMVMRTGCEHPKKIELDGHPALQCELNLISSTSASPDRHVPPSVIFVTGTCDGRVVDLVATSPLLATPMQRTFRCTPAPATGK